MLVTFFVLKFDKFKLVNSLHPENMRFIFLTFFVSNEDKFKELI